MPDKKTIALGLMSGTSCDGLTICAVQIRPFKVLSWQNFPYTPALQQRLLQAMQLRAPQLSALHFELGQLYAQKTKLFLKKQAISPQQIYCAGMHGQTIYHGPNDLIPNTLQLAEPSFLTQVLGSPVVSNFREKDIALGGQGAPLVPAFDEYIFGKGNPIILLNLGGIANISIVGKTVNTYGFDCGPANTLMDLACTQYVHRPYDKNGQLAHRGTVDKARVARLLKQPFFQQQPPKSLDKNHFGTAYLQRYFSGFGKERIADLLATLNYFTAAAVAHALQQFVPVTHRRQLIVSGGGAFNQTLLDNLQRLTQLPVCTTAHYGIDPQAKEAAAFAWFAVRACQHKPNHCPRATGACHTTVLGRISL